MSRNSEGYNCYSYAMGIYNKWINSKNIKELALGNWGHWKFLTENKGSIDKLVEIFVKKDVLVRFPKLVIVEERNIRPSTRLIAVRLAKDDFHFMKRYSNNKWYHKMAWDDIKPINKEQVFAKEWEGRYNSKIIFLGYEEDY